MSLDNIFFYALLTNHQHPELFVRFLCWFEDKNYIYIAMECVPYGDLHQYITSDPGNARTNAKDITRQILAGLVVLHDRKICHRDLKPQVGTHPSWDAKLTVIENILVSSLSPILVKITDFGISKNWRGTSLRTSCGTFNYQAPEQIGLMPAPPNTKVNSYTSAVDLWAAGAIVHLMLTSQIPFCEMDPEVDDDPLTSLSGLDIVTGNSIDLPLLLEYCRDLKPFPAESMRDNAVSEEGISVVTSLMAAKPSNRISAANALEGVWFGGTLSMIARQ